MEPIMACRLCLNTDVRLYDMGKYCLKSVYEDLCGNNPIFVMCQHVCAYCGTMLNKFASFKERCDRSAILMQVMLAEPTQVQLKTNKCKKQISELTTDHIRKINDFKNASLPYSIQVIHNLDSTTEVKEEYMVAKTNGIETDYDVKDIIEYPDFKIDSDDEPLSKKVTERRKKSKTEDSIQESSNTEVFESSDFDLILLTKEQQLEEVLNRKNSSNYKNSLHKCGYCFKGFMTELTFKNHMVRHDLSAGPLSCEICGSRWMCARSLRAHALTHARRYACRLCGHTATSHHKAKEHAKWHRGYRFVCKLCGATFSKSTTHLTHLRLHHAAARGGAACDDCGVVFLGQAGLNLHKRKAHRNNVESSITYVGCACGAKFRSEEALKRHHELFIDDICHSKLRHCEHCGEYFPDEGSHKLHVETHARLDALRTCTQCARTFASERSLGVHAWRAHGARRAALSVCELCGHKCTSRASLVYHQRTHTGERPYGCSQCPKRFSVSQRLQIHIRTHTGERPFKCPHCPKAFKHKAALNRHDRVHSGARPYRCETCGKCFSQSNSMKQHAASVHLRAPLYARRQRKDAVIE